MSECHCDFKEDCCCQEEAKPEACQVKRIIRDVLIVAAVAAVTILVIKHIRRR